MQIKVKLTLALLTLLLTFLLMDSKMKSLQACGKRNKTLKFRQMLLYPDTCTVHVYSTTGIFLLCYGKVFHLQNNYVI